MSVSLSNQNNEILVKIFPSSGMPYDSSEYPTVTVMKWQISLTSLTSNTDILSVATTKIVFGGGVVDFAHFSTERPREIRQIYCQKR